MKKLMKTLLVTLSALTLMAGTALAEADVQIIHNSPDPAAASVDIYLDGELAVPGLDFRAATGVLPLPSDVEIAIGIAPAGGEVIATFPVTLMGGTRYVVMATGVLDADSVMNPDGINTGFGLEVFDMLTTEAPAGEVGILAFHGIPDAPAVNIDVAGGDTLVPNLAFRQFAGYLTVPAADYVLQIGPASDPGTYVATISAPLSGLSGGAAVVFASGMLGGDFGFFAALADGMVLELPPTTVANTTSSMGGVKALFK